MRFYELGSSCYPREPCLINTHLGSHDNFTATPEDYVIEDSKIVSLGTCALVEWNDESFRETSFYSTIAFTSNRRHTASGKIRFAQKNGPGLAR